MKSTKSGNTLLLSILVAATLIVVGIYFWNKGKANSYPVVPVTNTQKTATTTSNQSQGTTTQQTPRSIAKKYSDEDFGFSFYYPNSWTLKEEKDMIILSNFGPSKDDRIVISRYAGQRITNSDAKFGTIVYYYNTAAKIWMVDKTNCCDGKDPIETRGVQEASPQFYTVSDLPVFIGTGRWKTEIVPLSPTEFIVVSIGGSGYTAALDPFVKTFTPFDASLTSAEINALVQAEIKAEKQ